MILALVIATCLGADDQSPTTDDNHSVIGTIQVGRGLTKPSVRIKLTEDGTSLRLSGEVVSELARLQSTKVELLGQREPKRFVVAGYRILSLPSGKRPLAVGVLVELKPVSLLGIQVDAGPPLPLNAHPKIRQQLVEMVGAKLWVLGSKLLSGEIQVTQFGVLRERQKHKVEKTQSTSTNE
ncbi:MAG: hypothetical protein JW841_13220 [Deltaproteobacteria bacterium]|nr:hypothetical protein [Deltaproteobacteria bacterium]